MTSHDLPISIANHFRFMWKSILKVQVYDNEMFGFSFVNWFGRFEFTTTLELTHVIFISIVFIGTTCRVTIDSEWQTIPKFTASKQAVKKGLRYIHRFLCMFTLVTVWMTALNKLGTFCYAEYIIARESLVGGSTHDMHRLFSNAMIRLVI
jgi:hypothetical protein